MKGEGWEEREPRRGGEWSGSSFYHLPSILSPSSGWAGL